MGSSPQRAAPCGGPVFADGHPSKSKVPAGTKEIPVVPRGTFRLDGRLLPALKGWAIVASAFAFIRLCHAFPEALPSQPITGFCRRKPTGQSALSIEFLHP